MNLLILPGAGDPFHESTKKATELLFNYAYKNKFNKVECISYPGHTSFTGDLDKELKIQTAKKTIIQALQNFEIYNDKHIVFVRSYGCNPYLDILANENIDLNFLNISVILGSSS